MYAKEWRESGEQNGRDYQEESEYFSAIDKAEDKEEVVRQLESKLWWRHGYPEVQLSLGSTPANTSSSDYNIKIISGEVEQEVVEQHNSDWYRHRTIRLVPKTPLAVVKISKEVHRGWEYYIERIYYIIKRD
jgi:hypothetical protein